MEEAKRHALGYLITTTTTVDGPTQPSSTLQSSATWPAALPSEPMRRTRLSRLLQVVSNLRYPSSELTGFLKRTRRFWLSTAGVIFGLLVLVALMDHVVESARNARARRHELAVATVTPDRLIARCGEAAHDITKQVFPILMRTMSYSRGDRTLVLTFSRTAEEKSDWVFLSMNDENGPASYETPVAKIAALPCLDSAK